METELKTCENCKFFEKHYRWNYDRFSYAYCGHCCAVTRRKKINLNKACENWSEIGSKREEREYKIKTNLFLMPKRIEDIAMLLEIEKNHGD